MADQDSVSASGSGAEENMSSDPARRRWMVEMQRCAILGRLAMGVAHDFNNLLTAILGCAELAGNTLSAGHPAHGYLQSIQMAGERGVDLTHQILSFARSSPGGLSVLDLNDLVLGADKILRRLIGEDLELVTILGPDVPSIIGEKAALQQIIFNLVLDVRGTLDSGGRLLLETHVGEYGGEGLELAPGTYVQLTLAGTGPLKESDAVRFELGWEASQVLVHELGGALVHSPVPNKGVVFRLFFPPVAEAQKIGAAPSFPLPTLPQGTGTILLAEDEPLVRDFTALALRAQGFTVLEASDGGQALRLARETSGPIDLLVTDVVMPIMGGKELALKVRLERPGLKVLFISGYTDRVLIDGPEGNAGVGFLQKPFTPLSLSRRVNELLEGS